MSVEEIFTVKTLIACTVLVCVLVLLMVAICRQEVKRDMDRTVRIPLRVRWRPLRSSLRCCAFDALFVDAWGRDCGGKCEVAWIGSAPVKWVEDVPKK